MSKLVLLLMLSLSVAYADLIKLGPEGAKLPDNATAWSCVLDDAINIVWQNPSASAAGYTYSWFDATSEIPGFQNGGRCGMQNRCDTQRYIEDNPNLCGFTGWRLPTTKELESLIYCPEGRLDDWVKNYQCKNYDSDGVSPQIKTAFFPYVKNSYWTADTYETLKTSANFVNFNMGETDRDIKETARGVILVRSGYSYAPKVVIKLPTWDAVNSILTIPQFEAGQALKSLSLQFDVSALTFKILNYTQ